MQRITKSTAYVLMGVAVLLLLTLPLAIVPVDETSMPTGGSGKAELIIYPLEPEPPSTFERMAKWLRKKLVAQ